MNNKTICELCQFKFYFVHHTNYLQFYLRKTLFAKREKYKSK